MNNLVFSSAVMTMSQTTEFMRNKSIDNIIIHLIVTNNLKLFTVKEAYDRIYLELPIRIEEIEKSLKRSLKNNIIKILIGDESEFAKARFMISDAVKSKIDKQYNQLNDFAEQAINELFKGILTPQNKEIYKSLLLESVSNLMAKYGYAYAGQLAGVADATEFVPSKELTQVCENAIKKYTVSISVKELSDSISYLFDRRDPCLNNLAFSICNRYYQSRLIGLDLPIDFLTENLYKDSVIFLDTNFIGNIAFTKTKRHNEFREILRNANKLGITFAASELTIAEIHARVQEYMPDLEAGEDLLPEEIIEEVRDNIIQQSHSKQNHSDFTIEESENTKRLKEMGVEIVKFVKNGDLCSKQELFDITNELHEADRKYRKSYIPKDERALFHDAYHYFLIRNKREKSGNSSAWFLSMDHSVIEHAISKKTNESPPYAIRLLSILQTLSQFIESQALKGEFSELFGELIAKDLLPREKLFDYDDLKLLIGFDIKAKEIPPEFIRKATHHIKTHILKGGGITDENRAEVIHEYTKYLSTPDQNFIEIQRKYDKKLRDRDDDIQLKENEILSFKNKLGEKDNEIDELSMKLNNLETRLLENELSDAIEKYQTKCNSFIETNVKHEFSSLRKIRIRYIIFLTISMLVFSILFFFEDFALLFDKVVTVNKYLKYGIAILVFLSPFIRSFFDHKKITHSFMVLKASYKEKIKIELENKYRTDFEKNNEKPSLKKMKNTNA